jgi:CBS domain-containing protein
MSATLRTNPEALRLRARTAAELMADNPVSLRADATAAEALRLFTTKGITAAPVIDDAGHPIGVLSRSDLLVHQRETAARPPADAAYFQDANLEAASRTAYDTGLRTTVADLMTPAVFAVSPDAPARRVVEEMLALRVHRLFVVDESGFLVGVISAMDILRNLAPIDAGL